MKAQVVTFTPELAQIVLRMNTCNRPVQEATVQAYADEMKNRTWKLNGETIKVTKSHTLLDGQHRLLACIRSDTPFEALYVTDVDDESAFDTIDIGRKRTGGDTFAVRGEKNTNCLAATLRLLCLYNTYGMIPHKDRAVSNQRLERTLENHPTVRESVAFAANKKWPVQLMSVTLIAFCHYVLTGINKEQGEEFIHAVLEGQGLAKGDPAYALRNRLMLEVTRGGIRGPMRSRHVIAMVFKAWNAYRLHKEMKVLHFAQGEEFQTAK